MLFALSFAVITEAQPFYLRGEASPCDWGNSSPSCQLTDPDNDGVFTLNIDFGASAIGRKEFKIYNAANDSWWPGNNAWFNHQGGSVTFRFNTANNQVEATEGTALSICAPGSFSGWNNATAMTDMGGGTWCYTIPAAGSYEWKPTNCGTWDSWQPTSGERSVNSSNWAVTTTSANEQVCVTYDPATGRVTPPAPIVGYYLRGSAGPCGWNNVSGGCQLMDPDGNGVYELTIDLGPSPIGRQEFKIYHAATDSWYPGGSNSWYIHQGGAVTFRFFSATGETEVVDGLAPSICAPGDFSGWNNSASMTDKGYGIWCYKVPTPGTYSWKPTVCGSWDSWQPGSGERSTGSDNWSVTTTTADEEICVTYFPATGQVAAGAITAVPTLSEWGLILFCLVMFIAGLVTIRQRKLVMAGTQDSSFSFHNLPFDRAFFTRALLVTGLMTVAVFMAAIVFFGYEITTADLPGSLLAIPLVAYLAGLLRGEKEK